MSFVGSTIGHIRIESRLGSGGMGEVYLGFDLRLGEKIALALAAALPENAYLSTTVDPD